MQPCSRRAVLVGAIVQNDSQHMSANNIMMQGVRVMRFTPLMQC